jgi:hypothetical protein
LLKDVRTRLEPQKKCEIIKSMPKERETHTQRSE